MRANNINIKPFMLELQPPPEPPTDEDDVSDSYSLTTSETSKVIDSFSVHVEPPSDEICTGMSNFPSAGVVPATVLTVT